MLEIENWAKNKDPLIQVATLALAPFAETAYEILTPIKKAQPQPLFTSNLHNIDFYNLTPLQIFERVAPCFSSINILGDVLSQLLLAICDRQPSEEIRVPRPFPDLSVVQFAQLQIEDIRDDISPGELTEDEKILLKKSLLTPEFSFLNSTVLPCYFFYETSHYKLFKKATSGETDALVKLLQLDKGLIEHSQVNKWLPRYSRLENKSQLFRLTDSLKNVPPGKVTTKNIKYKIAGALSLLSDLLDKSLTEPEIRVFFNALQNDYSGIESIDTDLPDSPESFSKAIQREKKHWKDLLHRLFPPITPFL